MKLIADKNTNITNQLEFLESLVTWHASLKKNIQANKNGCCALSIDFVGHAALEIQILYTWSTIQALNPKRGIFLNYTLEHTSGAWQCSTKVSSGCIFSQKQVLHTYPSFLIWQQRNFEVSGVRGRPQNFEVFVCVKWSFYLVKSASKCSKTQKME